MKLKLNFKVNKPTLNKRIYSKEIIIREFDKAIEKDLPIVLECNNNFEVDLNNIAGFVKSYNILEDDSIEVEINIINTPSGKILQKLCEDFSELKLSTLGIGNLKENMNINIFKLQCLHVDSESMVNKGGI